MKKYKNYQLKLTNLSKNNLEYFSRLFLESKWLHNSILEDNDPFKFKTSKTTVEVLRNSEKVTESFKYLSAAMREIIRLEIVKSITTLSKVKKRGRKVGKLKFKSFKNHISLFKAQVKIVNNTVRFQKYNKFFRVRGLDQLPKNYDLKCVTLLRKPSGIYLNICIEDLAEKETIKPKQYLGIDFGISSDFTFHNGTSINYEISSKTKKLKKLCSQLSRKKKGSNRFNKEKLRLAKYYEYLTNCKIDFCNKFNHVLKNFIVCFQDEQLSSWSKQFGKKIQKSVLGRVKLMLRKNTNNLMLSKSIATTKTCLKCEKINKISLNQKVYSCECGYQNHRDVHAALNMLKMNGVEYTSAEQKSDLWKILQSIQSKHFVMKRETAR